MRGRKPKPKALKLLEGTRKDRINDGEPRFRSDLAGLTVPPGWLSDLAVVHWNELATVLHGAGLLTEGDRPALALLCEEYASLRTDPTDSKARDRYRRMLVEFGLTPSSRSRLKLPAEPAADELDTFLKAGP